MNKEEKVKYDCKECVNYDCCSHSLNGCSLFKKKQHIVLEIDGVRHVMKPVTKPLVCFRCSLRGFCIDRSNLICNVLAGRAHFTFEFENNDKNDK